MWNSIIVIAGCFSLLMVLEESIYYTWNRYVYGPNEERKRKWKTRLKTVKSVFKIKQVVEIHDMNNEKSSQ